MTRDSEDRNRSRPRRVQGRDGEPAPRRDNRPPRRDGERRPPRRDGERRFDRDSADHRFGREDRSSRPPQEDRIPDPELPDEITAKDLAPAARNELKTLSKENADRVARHLAMSAQLIEVDPELAHEHALAATRHAGRLGVARETLAVTAYATGDFALALRELRTHRRITGRHDHIALIVDSERGVGRPEKALEEGRAVDRDRLEPAVRAELAIAMSGARLDLGQIELALHELDIPECDPDHAYAWSAGLFAARANVLEDLGLMDEAAQWRRRAVIAEDALEMSEAHDDVFVTDTDTEEFEEGEDATDGAVR